MIFQIYRYYSSSFVLFFIFVIRFLNIDLVIAPASIRCHFLNLSSIDLPSAKACQVNKVLAYLSQIKTRPAPWMARAYNPVGRAREARLQNIRFTCNPSLARNLLQGFKLADCVTGRVVEVKAIVRRNMVLTGDMVYRTPRTWFTHSP